MVPRVAAMGWVASAMEAAVERALGSVVELEAAMAVNWAVSKAVAMEMAYRAEGLEVAAADIHSVLHSHHSPFQRRNRRNRLIPRAHPRKSRLNHRKVYDPSIHWNTSIQVQAAAAYLLREQRPKRKIIDLRLIARRLNERYRSDAVLRRMAC